MVAPDPKPPRPLDAAIGLAAVAAGAAVSVSRQMVRAATPLGRAFLHPPVLSPRLHPAVVIDALAERGREVMASPNGDFERFVAIVVPTVVREVLDVLDLNAIIRERIDLVDIVASVDIAEMINRIDIETAVQQIDVDAVLRQVDIDAIVRRIDLDAVMQRIDLDAVMQRVDLDAVVQRVDLDAVVQRVDLDGVVQRVDLDAVVQRMDMDALVKRVDVNAIADSIDLDAVVERIDLDRIVDRIDIVGIAEAVINEIDLPEIIRNSTGLMASQAVRDARVQSIAADELVSRLADRLLGRRQGRSADTLDLPQSEAGFIPDGESKP
jgi:hypothetical protein